MNIVGEKIRPSVKPASAGILLLLLGACGSGPNYQLPGETASRASSASRTAKWYGDHHAAVRGTDAGRECEVFRTGQWGRNAGMDG